MAKQQSQREIREKANKPMKNVATGPTKPPTGEPMSRGKEKHMARYMRSKSAEKMSGILSSVKKKK